MLLKLTLLQLECFFNILTHLLFLRDVIVFGDILSIYICIFKVIGRIPEIPLIFADTIVTVARLNLFVKPPYNTK